MFETKRTRADLLDPFIVAQLGGVELVARSVVEGFLAGIHKSPFPGYSVEFTEDRPYQPGDDLRYLDWKMLARSDRLFVKQFEEETNMRSMLVLDASASMDWHGSEVVLSKFEYAKRLVASLALVLLRQRDATGLIAFDEEVRVVLRAGVRSNHWWTIARTLEAIDAGGGTAAEPALRKVTSLLRRRGLVVLASDLLFDRQLVLRVLHFLRHRGHEVLVLHIMDPAELTLDGPPEARFEDPESGLGVTARPRELRIMYQQTVQKTIGAWRAACRRGGIHYHHVRTDTPFGNVLRELSGRRSRLR